MAAFEHRRWTRPRLALPGLSLNLTCPAEPVPVLTGVLVGISVVQLVFGFVHGITLGFGATLIGEAVDYPAYLLTHVAAGERIQETLTRIWPTLSSPS